ncbi:6692_t:CDS:10 [Entrophospora sp. SA101]|nr:6692_t:CDS:10 [Entrophospora sp. SA101]
MGQRLSVPHAILSKPHSSKKKPILFITGGVVLLYILNQYAENEKKRQEARAARAALTHDYRNKRNKKVGVDARFFAQIRKLLPICIPGVATKEFILLISLAFVLIALKAIVSRDRKAFISRAVIEFGLMMWPMSVVNNSLKLTINALALSFRTRLTRYAHEQYLKDITFYKISNIDNRIQNADQLLTQDIDKFAENLSHLYSDIAKPLVDVILFAYKLGEAIDNNKYYIYIVTAIEQKLEGDFRFTHSRIITHSEEIAFYGGNNREKAVVNGSFDKIVRHVKKIYRLRFFNGIIDSVLVKYSTEFMGKMDADPTKIMEDYSRNSGYLVNLSQAIGRLILAGRDLTRFAGYTSRVAELFDVLEDVNKGRYERAMVVSKDSKEANVSRAVTPSDLKGKIIRSDGVIIFEKVPIITPNYDVLVKELSFKVQTGMNCLISGPNGCVHGVVTKPTPSKLFYVPQKPYLALGTFRDQIIYPDTRVQSRTKGWDDEKLMELLEVVHLGYLVEREGGWDAVQDWADVLSGGEKQRVAMARLFYHRPQFAILDECTSAVSVDVEGIMYTYARKVGITLFTVSHRHSLWLLRFDGEGGYEFRRLEESDLTTPFSLPHTKQSNNKFVTKKDDEE